MADKNFLAAIGLAGHSGGEQSIRMQSMQPQATTKPVPLTQRLAVCSWSLQPASPQDLDLKLQAAGIRRVQLALDPLRNAPGVWGDTAAFFRERGITVVSGMVGCV